MDLENCQRKFTKLISGLEDLSYRDRLRLTTLLKRRARGDLIEIFKIARVLLLMASICLEMVTLDGNFSWRLHPDVRLTRTL